MRYKVCERQEVHKTIFEMDIYLFVGMSEIIL